MIKYKFEEEKDFILHYARELDRPIVVKVIEAGQAVSSEEANALAQFFWDMVDEIVKDKKNGKVVAGQSDLEAWNEYVFESIRSYLRNNGYEQEWENHA
ncbi:MAG TPA: hypothetical protein VL987_03665 [Cellvibrio sp.]|nr:hypothetical protein [Cellvibrio sp.]